MSMHAEQQPEAIAIIGMEGRFPGAENIDTYWKNLLDGVDAVTRFADDELDPSVPENIRRQPGYVPARGVLKDAECFDAEFFGISPREAEILDPQQRVFLEMAWHALENAGYAPGTNEALIGVYAGMSYNTYFAAHVAKHPRKLAAFGDMAAMIANEKDYLATRTAYKLDLRGPAINVSTACSTSLVAICQACSSLLEYQCDIALAGGISVLCPQARGYQYTEGGIYSPDGRCRPFDADANGTLFGNGGGVVVLKRLSEALADGDTVHAVIRGHALNNDGAGKVSFTAPSVEGQANVVRMANEMAGFSPDDVDYIEAHGTGTSLGDPIEIAALAEAYRGRRRPCHIGSVKGNIGHLDVASGVAGLIKAVLALREGRIPGTLNFRSVNPRLEIERTPFRVVANSSEWPATNAPRRAAVSSFGLGGTNAHVVLEQAPPLPATSAGRPRQLLVLSAKTANALRRQTALLAEHLAATKDTLADIAWTLQAGRRAFPHRLAFAAADAADALARLRARTRLREAEAQDAPRAVFMFPGQGAQYAGMGSYLYEHEPVVRKTIDACADAVRDVLDHDLRDVMFGRSDDAVEVIDETRYTQPALFALELAIARLWMSWDVQPAAMLGHSIGEFVAATIAGVFSDVDAMRVVAERGRLMQAQPGGSMLSVRLAAEELRARLIEGAEIAAINAPGMCVVAGSDEVIRRLAGRLDDEGIRNSVLRTSHAFHSASMEAALQPFEDFLRGVELKAPKLPVISTVTGRLLSADEACNPRYWAMQMREAVRFEDALVAARRYGALLLECGPGVAASTFASQTFADDDDVLVIASLGRRGDSEDELDAMLDAAARAWTRGANLDWRAMHSGERRRRVPAPGYSFERTRHWLEASGEAGQAAGAAVIEQTAATPANEQLPLPERVRHVLAEVTGLAPEALAEDASFTELGLDSLALTQLGQVLRKRFGVDLRFRQLLNECNTLSALIALIGQETQPEKAAGDAPPLPGARLGRRPDGSAAWFIPDPERPGRYREVRARNVSTTRNLT